MPSRVRNRTPEAWAYARKRVLRFGFNLTRGETFRRAALLTVARPPYVTINYLLDACNYLRYMLSDGEILPVRDLVGRT